LETAFVLGPVETEPLEQVTDAVVDTLIRISGDPNIGGTFVAYLKFGASGPDGRTGTEDDLKNPLLALTD